MSNSRVERIAPPHQASASTCARAAPVRWIAILLCVSACLSAPAALADADGRITVPIPHRDRLRLQEDMREFLRQNTDLLNAALDEDMARVHDLAQAARPPLARIRALAGGLPLPASSAGAPAAKTGAMPKRDAAQLYYRMQKNLPQGFKDMLLGMRETLADIEKDAQASSDAKHSLRQLATIQSLCVSCHSVYRVVSRN